tara:strand:- start:873 stop:2348 length:1476 start_codon:yes stop_codon:yes gene_type:complete
MPIRRVRGKVSPSELTFAAANALETTYDDSGITIERGETFTLSTGSTAVSNGTLRLEALTGNCTLTNNGTSTLTNASGVTGTIIMSAGTSDDFQEASSDDSRNASSLRVSKNLNLEAVSSASVESGSQTDEGRIYYDLTQKRINISIGTRYAPIIAPATFSGYDSIQKITADDDGLEYYLYIYTTSDSSVEITSGIADVLVVAGGGGCGSRSPGGGGGGGVIWKQNHYWHAGNYEFTIGNGGTGGGGGGNNAGTKGGNSYIRRNPSGIQWYYFDAIGGGEGYHVTDANSHGGSGGGGSAGHTNKGLARQKTSNPTARNGSTSLQADASANGGAGSHTPDSITYGHGNDGGTAPGAGYGGAGGGGAGAVGGNPTTSGTTRPAGDGGHGLGLSEFLGVDVGDHGFFGGGGGGGSGNSSSGMPGAIPGGKGGKGGGGAGAGSRPNTFHNKTSQAGTDGTGGGAGGGAGGGSGGSHVAGAAGGKGVIIMRVLKHD